MDIFRNFVQSIFPGRAPESRKSPFLGDIFPDGDEYKGSHSNGEPDEWYERPGGVFSDPGGFSSSFEDMRRRMDESFDEMFRIFGIDSIPMFDGFISPEDGTHPAYREEPNGRADSNADNVHERMLKRHRGDRDTGDAPPDINVRSRMLKGAPQSRVAPSGRELWSGQSDLNWDSMLREGRSVNDILDGKTCSPHHHNSPFNPDARANPQGQSFFKSVRITTTRKPDGTIEIRRITRDSSGNEHETVEVTKGS